VLAVPARGWIAVCRRAPWPSAISIHKLYATSFGFLRVTVSSCGGGGFLQTAPIGGSAKGLVAPSQEAGQKEGGRDQAEPGDSDTAGKPKGLAVVQRVKPAENAVRRAIPRPMADRQDTAVILVQPEVAPRETAPGLARLPEPHDIGKTRSVGNLHPADIRVRQVVPGHGDGAIDRYSLPAG